MRNKGQSTAIIVFFMFCFVLLFVQPIIRLLLIDVLLLYLPKSFMMNYVDKYSFIISVIMCGLYGLSTFLSCIIYRLWFYNCDTFIKSNYMNSIQKFQHIYPKYISIMKKTGNIIHAINENQNIMACIATIINSVIAYKMGVIHAIIQQYSS